MHNKCIKIQLQNQMKIPHASVYLPEIHLHLIFNVLFQMGSYI